jgi:hypothetical protein
MARKPARPKLVHTREFIDEDGTPAYIERRGLRELKTPLSKQARSLKKAGEKTLNEVLEGVKPSCCLVFKRSRSN